MKQFKRILLSISLLGTLTYSDTTNTALDSTSYVESMPDQSSCMFECPKMKEGFFARVKDIIPSSGETQCFVYKASDPSTILGYVSTTNEKCKVQYNLTEDEEYKVDKNKEDDEFGLENIHKKYSEHYVNTGGREYLRTSKYLISGLTADSEIINIPDSVTRNRLVLNDKYTIYPNASTSLPDSNFAKTVSNTLSSIWSSLTSYFTDEKIVKAQYKGYENELSSLSEVVFSSIIAFILNWLAEADDVLLNMNSTLFFIVFPLSAGLFFLSKATKALGDKQDHDDNYEKGFVTILILFVFYFSSGDIKLNNDKHITQTNFQTWSRPILYEGVEFADKMTLAFTKAYLDYKSKDAGLMEQKEFKQIYDETLRLKKENTLLENSGSGILGACYQVYDTNRLRDFASPTVGANTVFPPLGTINTNKGITNLEETAFLKPEYRRSDNVPTLGACYNFERRYMENKKKIQGNEITIEQYKKAMAGNKSKEGIKLVAELMYKNTADLGFINASNIASTNILLDNIDLFSTADIHQSSVERAIELDRRVTGKELSDIALGSTASVLTPDAFYSGMRWIALNTPYMMVPPASTIKSEVVQPIIETSLSTMGKGFSFIIDKVTKATGIIGMAKTALDTLSNESNKNDSALTKGISSFLALIVTILIMKYFLAYIPLVAISVAGYLSIGFYYVSVEIFYLVAPFVAIYALSTEQMSVLKNFTTRFLALAFKPVLIVISIVIAIIAMELLNRLGMLGAHKTFDTFFAITQFDRNTIDLSSDMFAEVGQGISWLFDFKDYGLLFFKGLLLVGSNVVSLLVVFYLVFYGSTMLLNIFGIKDSGIDAQDTIGSQVEGKSSKYHVTM